MPDSVKVYEVRDVDGTSYTGASKLVGFYLDELNAKAAAADVKRKNSWNDGIVIPHDIVDGEWKQ